MDASTSDNLWNQFLRTRRFDASLETVVESFTGKIILLTGAGGCIGSALAKALLSARPDRLVLLDHSEHALHRLMAELDSLSHAAPYTAVLGDVQDEPLLRSLLRENSPNLILHAAAFKHVPLMEGNPFAAIRNNAVATWQLARLAADFRVPRFLLISTDKAANPRSIMGASKRLAEISVSRWSAEPIAYSAIRLGNVLGSQGSVVPLFLEQIARGGPVTVTHPEVSRYFLTLGDAVHLIISAATLSGEGGLVLPELGEPIRIVKLAEFLIDRCGNSRAPETEIRFTSLRPGDKLTEDLLSASEELHPTSDSQLWRVSGPALAPAIVDATMERLKRSAQECDLAMMLAAVRELAPEYVPGATLLNFTAHRTPVAQTGE